MHTLKSEGRSAVLIGSFNPAIFQPMWFAKENLIDENDAKNAKVVVISPDFTVFSIDTGFQFQIEVQKSRLAVTSRNPACWPLLHDLIAQTFEILEHTPISQLGINRDVHYRVSSDERWKEIGDILAPKHPWHQLIEPKTNVVVIHGQRESCEAKYVQATVRPSPLFPGQKVLEISTNEHYTWEPTVPAGEAARMITTNWDNAYNFSKALGESILESEKVP